MALTKPNDIAIHEAGHVLISYLMSNLVEIHCVTIDTEYSKAIDEYSDGGLVFKYIKSSTLLNYLDLDQFCLLNLAGLAADLINEHNGKITNDYFFTEKFPEKIQHFNYQGDMIAFNNHFHKLREKLRFPPSHYNYLSIKLLIELFSNTNVLRILIEVRDLVEGYKTIDGRTLVDYLDFSYLRNWKISNWQKIKDARKDLFF